LPATDRRLSIELVSQATAASSVRSLTAQGLVVTSGSNRNHVTIVLSVMDWRRRIAQLYADVRAAAVPVDGHARWRAGRDTLFRDHPASPLPPDDPLRTSGLPYWPYDPALRFDVAVTPPARDELRTLDSASDGLIRMRLVGQVVLPDLGIGLDVWWLDQYAGGLFLPLRDGTAGTATYGGGRYLLDTAKGADLGGADRLDGTSLTIDLNFLYHPSCRYNDAWECPLAPAGNTTRVPIAAGERLHHNPL
jgi:uncharacterized protein